MLKLALIVVMAGAVLHASCVVCALTCCCDLMPAKHTTNTHDCHGSIHFTHVNLDWNTIEHEPVTAMRIVLYVVPVMKLAVSMPDLAVDTPPPEVLTYDNN